MTKRKRSCNTPKRSKGRKSGCRLRKIKHKRFLEGSHAKLKNALDKKLTVVKVCWKAHYAIIYYIYQEEPEKIYCNFKYLCYLLRCSLFYPPAPKIIVNLYYFSELEERPEGNFLIYHGFFWEKLVGKDQKEVGQLKLLLQSNQSFQNARRLCK
jgi:hypothetical protein